jgi:hypothetical protein
LQLHDAELNYVNKETGFTIRYAFDSISSKPGAGGTVLVAGIGKINGEPWKANGEVDPPGENADQRSFSFTGAQAGLTSTFAGTYTIGDRDDLIDAVFTGSAPELSKLLAVYDVKNDFEGNGTVIARLSAGSTSPGCRPSARLMLVVSRTGRRTSTARLFAGKPRECVRSREVGQPGTTHVSSSGRAAGAARAPGKSFLPIGRMTPLWWRRYNKDHRRGTKRGSCKRDWPVHVQHLPKPPENNE